MSLSELVTRRDELRNELRKLQDEFNKQKAGLDSQLNEVQAKMAMAESSLDVETIKRAETILYVSGEYGPYGDDDSIVAKAITDLAGGAKQLRTEYFGAKNFDRWHHQGSSHSYGYGPRHGSIVFAIGLTTRARQGEIERESLDAAIYYLLNLKKIQSARKAHA